MKLLTILIAFVSLLFTAGCKKNDCKNCNARRVIDNYHYEICSDNADYLLIQADTIVINGEVFDCK